MQPKKSKLPRQTVFHVRSGDEVVVLSGNHKGSRGKIIEMIRKKSQVIVEGVRMIKKHTRKSQENPQGAIVEKEGPLHVSTVMKAEIYDASPRRKAPKA